MPNLGEAALYGVLSAVRRWPLDSHDAGAFVLEVSELPIESRAVRERRPLFARLRPLYIREQKLVAQSLTANFAQKFAIHIRIDFGRLQAKAEFPGPVVLQSKITKRDFRCPLAIPTNA